MIYNFPTLQQGMDNLAFDIARPAIQKGIDASALLAKQAMVNRGLLPNMPGPTPDQRPQQQQQQQPDPNFGGFRALGGPVMPGRSYMVGDRPSGPANPVAMSNPAAGPPGTVWNAAQQRWVPMSNDAVGGKTTWDVANFGKYSGFGTSQGPIGRGTGTPTGHSGLSEFYADNPDQQRQPDAIRPATPAPFASNSLRPVQNWMSTIGKRALGTAPGQVEQPGVPLEVGDAMDPATAAMMAAYTRDSYATGNGPPAKPLPELMVSPSGVQVVGANGPEVVVPQEPSYIIPNPQTVAAARTMGVPSSIQMGQIAQAPAPIAPLQLAALPPVAQQPAPAPAAQQAPAPQVPTGYQPIGANYQPSQPGLQWTGSGFAHAPGGIRKTDLRRFQRSPEGVKFAIGQAAEQQRMDNFMARDDARFDRMDQANTNERTQAKAEKAAEDAAADARLNSMLDALSSDKRLLTPTQRSTLGSIKGYKERQAALDVFMRANEAEADAAARAAEKSAGNSITWQEVPGADYLAGIDGTGRMIQTLPKSRPNAQPIPVPAGMRPVRMNARGEMTYEAATSNAAPEIKTIKVNGEDVSVEWTGKGWRKASIMDDSTPVDTSGNLLPLGIALPGRTGTPSAGGATVKPVDDYFRMK